MVNRYIFGKWGDEQMTEIMAGIEQFTV